jgi:polyhydroxyalkanoate synthesis regulator phasin
MLLSDSNARRAALLPQRKLDVLARLPAPVVDDMFNEGELDGVESMTRDQLQEIVQLRKQLESRDKKITRMGDTIAEQDEQLRKQSAMPATTLYIYELRRAVLDETEALRANIASLHTIMDQVRLLPQDTSQADIDSIAHPLMYALQGVHASAGAVFERGFDEFAVFKPDMDVMPPMLDKDEAKLAQRRAREFADRVEQRDVLRKTDVAAEQSQRKGRKG